MRYSESYRERVVLDDGTPIVLRAIVPTDKAALADGFAQLSEETRRRRFLLPKSALSDEELRFFTEFDGIDHYAIGALVDGDPGGQPTGVGVARLVRVPDDPSSAELGIVVADAWQHRGIGKTLLKRIVAAAGERGLERIRGETLAGNKQIRSLLERHAKHLETHQERGILQFSFPVQRAGKPGLIEAVAALLRLAALAPIVTQIASRRLCLQRVRNVLEAAQHDNSDVPASGHRGSA